METNLRGQSSSNNSNDKNNNAPPERERKHAPNHWGAVLRDGILCKTPYFRKHAAMGSPENTGIVKRALAEILRFAEDSHSQEFEKCGLADQDVELAYFLQKEPALVLARVQNSSRLGLLMGRTLDKWGVALMR